MDKNNPKGAGAGPDKNTPEPVSEREVSIERVFDMPARVLFLACSKPEHMMRWFGPKGFPLTLCEMDFRPGGRYRFAMSSLADGGLGVQMTPFGGEYLEIIPNQKIAYTNSFEQPGAEQMIVTLTFVEEGAKTRLTIHTVFASIAMKNKHLGMGYQQGVGSGLDQLSDYAATLWRS
jgi:uncharacterized protein YndB with AHSA1/START domain